MSSTPNPINVRFPFELKGVPHEVVQAHRYAFQGLVDLNQAVAAISTQIRAFKPQTPVAGGSVATSTSITVNGNAFSGLGAIRDQTGSVTYTTVGSDNGILLILNDASPVAVTLDSAMATPFFLFSTNFGVGSATFTPSSGTINGTASFTLPQNYTSMLVFDGTNWHASALLVLPHSAGPTSHQWLASYDSATELFTLSQPDFTDITGQITTSQLPASGLTVTITTAALTTLGTQGSMQFQNGILIAQTPAT